MTQDTPTSSALYKTLHATALAFLNSLASPSSASPSSSPLPTLLTPSYTHSFAPTYFISQTPHLQGPFNLAAFLTHLATMTARLESWKHEVRDICVDEVKRMVVVRASYFMKVRGEEAEVVENDLVWWLWMDGEGGRVSRSVEVLDAVASGRLSDLMDGAGAKGMEGA
ncbi:hypothetical protein CC80DRAFT_589999 [Byssothecium circinans]|uniref:SnoaL-like domain-containing protein n=1 Tax=Byssothecium circinans TaxID=147558 RepID=A0A6A5UHR6_9PLEO|nr:hypothetical protein CC80DRAFT_589999 [Byssothecium circinans]